VALVFLLAGSRVAADDGSFTITLDAATSQVTFELGAVFHTVHGRGPVEETVLTYAPAAGTLNGIIRMPATGLTTDNQRRDRKMHGQVLKSAEHPWIIMKLQRADGFLNPESGGALQIEAELVLLGQGHPVSFPVEISIIDPDSGRVRAAGAFSVPYVAWGLEDPSAVFLRVDKEVRVTFSADGTLAPASSP
jgi:hypothetical protein